VPEWISRGETLATETPWSHLLPADMELPDDRHDDDAESFDCAARRARIGRVGRCRRTVAFICGAEQRAVTAKVRTHTP
jgi:hypothetical protein